MEVLEQKTVGIEETTDVLRAIRFLIAQHKEIFAAGHVGLSDIKRLVPAFEALKKAKEGISEVPNELKDLNGEELGLILMELTEIVLASYGSLIARE